MSKSNFDVLDIRILEVWRDADSPSSNYVRICNILSQNGVDTMYDLVKCTKSGLLCIKGLGISSVSAIKDFLDGLHLKLGMTDKEISDRLDEDSPSPKTKADSIDWEARRYEISKELLKSIVSLNPPLKPNMSADELSNLCVWLADGLINRLKKDM